MTQDGLAVVLDLAAGAFVKAGALPDIAADLLGRPPPELARGLAERDLRSLSRELKGVRVGGGRMRLPWFSLLVCAVGRGTAAGGAGVLTELAWSWLSEGAVHASDSLPHPPNGRCALRAQVVVERQGGKAMRKTIWGLSKVGNNLCGGGPLPVLRWGVAAWRQPCRGRGATRRGRGPPLSLRRFAARLFS